VSQAARQDAPSPADSPSDDKPPVGKARLALLKRMADVVCLPSSRVNAFERAMTADLLIEMLREASFDQRQRVARRLASLTDIPVRMLRLLLRDQIEVASALLGDETALSEAVLIDCARHATQDHRLLIAKRRNLGELVCETLIGFGEEPVIEALLKNLGAHLSTDAIDTLVASSQKNPAFIPALLRRAELRPAHAYVIFWWAEPESRRLILTRFAVGREVLQDSASDVFPMAAAENWQDPLVRKAMQFIERRQRNRAAIANSPYASLDDAVAEGEKGVTRELVREISALAGIKSTTGAKILSDPYGEPIAIICKATGLPRSAILSLWRGLRRPETDSSGAMVSTLQNTLLVYDLMAVDRAQTVLRYWNWALTSALTPAVIRAIQEGEALDEFSEPQRAAALALAQDFGR
jgi:uncharacterized protein (DUF2336 family)